MQAEQIRGVIPAVGSILDDIRNGAWFAALGAPPLESESTEIVSYLQGLGLDGCQIRWAQDWQEVREIIQNPDWNPGWWQAEEAEKEKLSASANDRLGKMACLEALSDVMTASAALHGTAAIAAARNGLADPGLIRAAAGAASHTAHHTALAMLADAGPEHPFAAKFRLFVAGRWPLCVVGETYYIF